MMPEMDGLTLCRKIRQNVNINYLPIILLTARTSEEDNLEGLDTGADAYLMKPFSIELLRKTVLNLIRRREQLRNAFSGRQNQEEQISIPEVKSPDDRLMERKDWPWLVQEKVSILYKHLSTYRAKSETGDKHRLPMPKIRLSPP